MNGTLRKMVLAIFFSFAVLYMLFLFPYVELCRTGKYDGSITVSGNYTDWEITEARTSIYTCRVDGERRYAVSEMWLNGKHFGMDCPALTPGKEVTAEDYDGNFWYVFLPQEQARIPAHRFKTALFALLAYLCILSVVYWFYWRPRLIAEKESSAMAKEKFQEKVREMEEVKSAIFSGKKESEENPQDEVYLYLEDFEGNPTRVPQSNAKEFLAAMEKARERIKQGLPPFEEREPTQEELDAKERSRIEDLKRFVLMMREHPEYLENLRQSMTPEKFEAGMARLKAAEDELTKLGISLSPSEENPTKQS